MRGWVDLDSPDPLKPLPTGWENTEGIASLYSYSQVLTEPVSLLGLPCHFNKAAAYRPKDGSGGLTTHSHRFDCNWLKLMCLCKSSVFTAFAFIGALSSCASFHRWPIKVYPRKSINTRAIPNQTPTPLNGKTVIPSGRDPSPLSNLGGTKTDGRPAFWSAHLITSFIAECLGKRPALYLQDKPCKPLLSILSPQRQEWGIQTSAHTLRPMATLKLSGSSSVPSDETGKALSQAPLSFCAVAINLALDTWSASSSILSQFYLTVGRSQPFWRLGSSFKEASPQALLQDSTASASSLVSAMLILERIVSTNSPTEFTEAMKEGRAISPALLHLRPPKLTGNPACLHTSPSNDTLATLPRESKKKKNQKSIWLKMLSQIDSTLGVKLTQH